jgi:hypothetical protein
MMGLQLRRLLLGLWLRSRYGMGCWLEWLM